MPTRWRNYYYYFPFGGIKFKKRILLILYVFCLPAASHLLSIRIPSPPFPYILLDFSVAKKKKRKEKGATVPGLLVFLCLTSSWLVLHLLLLPETVERGGCWAPGDDRTRSRHDFRFAIIFLLFLAVVFVVVLLFISWDEHPIEHEDGHSFQTVPTLSGPIFKKMLIRVRRATLVTRDASNLDCFLLFISWSNLTESRHFSPITCLSTIQETKNYLKKQKMMKENISTTCFTREEGGGVGKMIWQQATKNLVR